MRRGFTLVEILMVVVILGIAGAIIVPQISTRDDMRAAAAARMLMADLIYSQNLAITSSANCYIKFDTVNQKYSVMDSGLTVVQHPVNHTAYDVQFASSTNKSLQQMSIDSASLVGASGTAKNYLGFDDLGTPLAYDGSGSPETLTTGSIVLKCGTYKMKVDIEPYTGQISVTSIN
jgi:prepilin-type N-terminal cleavage/methylation domain-containing protein